MKKTPEELAKLKADRIKTKKETEIKFPGVTLMGTGALISLSRGEEHFLDIKINSSEHQPESPSTNWIHAFIVLDRIDDLARFIVALTARLNALVSEANENIGKISVLPVQGTSTDKTK